VDAIMIEASDLLWEDELGCEQQILVDSVDLVVTELPQWLSDIRVATAERDIERLQGLLQAMRQSMAILGTDSICQRARNVERLVADRRWTSLSATVEMLCAECVYEAWNLQEAGMIVSSHDEPPEWNMPDPVEQFSL
jgi:hypothetical protein